VLTGWVAKLGASQMFATLGEQLEFVDQALARVESSLQFDSARIPAGLGSST
jgi:hypothetical protein